MGWSGGSPVRDRSRHREYRRKRKGEWQGGVWKRIFVGIVVVSVVVMMMTFGPTDGFQIGAWIDDVAADCLLSSVDRRVIGQKKMNSRPSIAVRSKRMK